MTYGPDFGTHMAYQGIVKAIGVDEDVVGDLLDEMKTTGMSLDLPAAPELMSLTAQCLATTRGFGAVEDREWHISKLYFLMSSQGVW